MAGIFRMIFFILLYLTLISFTDLIQRLFQSRCYQKRNRIYSKGKGMRKEIHD